MGEVWKAIPDFEGLYEASSLGRIRSLDRMVTGKNGVTKRFSGRVIAEVPMNAGYVTVALSKDGNPVRYLVHRLVAFTFIPNPDERPEVNHKNGVKSDNRIDNLEWMGRGANIDHAVETGLIRNKGELNPAAKLTGAQVMQIKELSRYCLHPNELARAFNVKPGTITDIQLSRSWQHIHASGVWSEIRKERGHVSRVTIEVYEVGGAG